MSLVFRRFLSVVRRCCFDPPIHWCGGLLIAIACLGGSFAQAAPFIYLADRATDELSVVDMSTYLTVLTTPLAPSASPVNVVTNKATKKIYVGMTNSVVIFDAVTNTKIGEIPITTGPLLFGYSSESQSLVVTESGNKAYVLTAGLVSVLDLSTKSVVAMIVVPPQANGMALDRDGDSLYVATGNFSPAAAPSIVVINALTNKIDSVVSTGTLNPLHIGMHPDDNHLYIIGNRTDGSSGAGYASYAVLDVTTAKLSEFAVVPPPGTELLRQFDNFVFNQDGSRLYLAPATLNMTTIPVVEVNTVTGAVTRILPVPSGYADEHHFSKMAASFADGKFILAFSIVEHLHHYPAEPPRRVVFVDGISGTVIKQLVYPPSAFTPIVADILDPSAVPPVGKVKTTTILQASTNPPLRPNIPLVLDATTSGNSPTGTILFEFVKLAPHMASHALSLTSVQVRRPLVNGAALLSLPACTAPWTDHALRHVVCSKRFEVAAVYLGDRRNRKSASAIFLETR